MKIEAKELKEYVESSLTAIKNGIAEAGFRISEPVEFNVAVTNVSESGGGLKIYVVEAGGKLKSEEISHVKFKVRPGLGYSIDDSAKQAEKTPYR